MRSKYTLKGQILDTGQEFAPFYEKEVSEALIYGTRFRSWVVKISFPILALISSNVPKASSGQFLTGGNGTIINGFV